MVEHFSSYLHKKLNIPQLIPHLGMFAIAVVLWIPFGFKTSGLIEEIGITSMLDSGEQLFFITPTSAMSVARGRPFLVFFHALAYALDPNSYFYYNIFQMLFFFGKMVVVYWLLLVFLPNHKLLAFITGILFALYPADTGLFSLRTIQVHSATLAYLLATYLLLLFGKLRGRASWCALLAAAFFLLFNVWQYPSAIPVVVVTPLFLFYFGRPKLRFVIGALVWYGTLALALAYSTAAIGAAEATVQSYDGGFIERIQDMAENAQTIVDALLVGYERQISAWFAAFGKLNYLTVYWPFFLISIGVIVTIAWWFIRNSKAETLFAAWWRYVLLQIAGLAIFAVGLSAYLVVPELRFQEFRTYILAMLGSALFLTITLYLISRLFKRYQSALFVVLALPFVGLALVNAFAQHHYYDKFSLIQQNVLQKIVTQAPELEPGTVILLADRAGLMTRENVFYLGSYLPIALRYLYNDPNLLAFYCPADGSGAMTSSVCHFENDSLILETPSLTVPYDRVLLFTANSDTDIQLLDSEDAANEFEVTNYNPQARIIGNSLPLRATTLFSCDPVISCFHEIHDVPTTSFDLPISGEIGFGWRDAEMYSIGGAHRWAIAPTAAIDVDLSDTSDLVVEFKILKWIDAGHIDSLSLSIHGQPIPLTFVPASPEGRIYRGVIPREALMGKPAHTQLIFKISSLPTIDIVHGTYLGYALSWLTIRPA